MKRLLLVLVVLVAVVAGIGWYRGWFTVAAGTDEVNMKMDRDKIKEDEEKAKAKLEGLKGQVQDKVEEAKKDSSAKTAGDHRN
jgi:hypothetical protein